ncbi:hypothetical protein ACWD3G_41725, partial [Streptomyces sp. NPDC002692]
MRSIALLVYPRCPTICNRPHWAPEKTTPCASQAITIWSATTFTTQPGRDFARQQRLHLVDRTVLAQWVTGGRLFDARKGSLDGAFEEIRGYQ